MERDSSCNVSEGTPNRGLSLYEAARLFNVPFTTEARPQDGEVEAGGLRFHYLEWGKKDAPPVLLLHGIAQQCHSWDFISLALSDKYRIIALDARGHGDSQWPGDSDYSLEAHQRDLDAVVEALCLKDFVLIGHSMGGRNGYIFTSRRPELVKALVIVDTGPGTGCRKQPAHSQLHHPPRRARHLRGVCPASQRVYRTALVACSWEPSTHHQGDAKRQVDLEVRQGDSQPGIQAPKLAHRGPVALYQVH